VQQSAAIAGLLLGRLSWARIDPTGGMGFPVSHRVLPNPPTMGTVFTRSSKLKPPASHIAMALPYAAILIGLHGLGSAWLAILLYHAGIALYLLRAKRENLTSSLLRGWDPASGAALSLLCVGNGPLLVILWPMVAIEPGSLSTGLTTAGLGGVSGWLFAGYYVSVHPVLEEALWRGALFSDRRGIAASDVAFAGYHALVLPYFVRIGWVPVVCVILALVAWMWRRAVRNFHGLAIPIVTHALAGLATMAAAYILANR